MRNRGETGQVAVEQALVMPLMVFLILGIVQLTMLQQARIMTDYAAFCAARAGVVWNGDKTKMEQAATLALVPTMGRSDSWTTYAKTAIKAMALQFAGGLVARLPGLRGLEPVKVTVLNPKPAVFTGKLAKHLNGQEIDFDDIRDDAIQANLLSIQVRYFYVMRIPFANWMIQDMWLGTLAGTNQYWHAVNFVTNDNPLASPALTLALGAKNYPGPLVDKIVVFGARAANIYLFPITATYTMRMQSNLYRKNVP